MDAKFEMEEYRKINEKVQNYLDACKNEEREIESSVIVDTVVNSITVKLTA